MHIEKFSVGFGKAIYRWKWLGVDFQIGWIPLGGFVALPQLDPGDEPQARDGTVLPVVKPIDRILVAIAGPVCNVIFGLFLATIVWKVGIFGLPPAPSVTVEEVPQYFETKKGDEIIRGETPEWLAGLRRGHVITNVNGTDLKGGWPQVVDLIVYDRDGRVALKGTQDDGEAFALEYQLVGNPIFDGVGVPFFHPVFPIFAKFVQPGPAREAGVKTKDQLIAVNGKPITSGRMLQNEIQQAKNSAVTLTVTRGKKDITLTMVPAIHEEAQRYVIGVVMESGFKHHPPPWSKLTKVAEDTYRTVGAVSSSKNPIGVKHLSSILGMINAIWTVLNHSSWVDALDIVVFINFALAIFNLLPIPVLDGGHITLALIELIARRRVPARLTIAVYNACAIVLISLMMYIFFHDARRMVQPPHRQSTTVSEPPAPANPPPQPATETQ